MFKSNKGLRQQILGAFQFAAMMSAFVLFLDVITSFGNLRSINLYIVAFVSITVSIMALVLLANKFNL